LKRVPGGTKCTFVRIPAVPLKFRRARERLCSSRIPGLFQLESGRVNPALALPRVLKQMKTALLQLATAETYPTSASADGQRKPGSSLPGVLGRNATGVVKALVRSPSQRCSSSPGQSLLGVCRVCCFAATWPPRLPLACRSRGKQRFCCAQEVGSALR